MASEFSGARANSIDDAERPDRVASISAGRPWVDPTVKMHVCEVHVDLCVYYFPFYSFCSFMIWLTFA